jgi:hypothetical protein
MASVYVVYFTHIVGIIVAPEDWFVIDAFHLNKYVLVHTLLCYVHILMD